MNCAELIDELKKYINKSNKNIEKRIVNTNEVSIDDFYAGIIENELIDSKKYEIYIFVEYKDNVASPLLYEVFNDKKQADEYFSELNELIKKKNLDKIREKCQN